MVKSVNGRNKYFLKGGKIKGCYSEFGNKDSEIIYVGEGLATCMSILLAKPDCLVVVAYGCHYLKDVAQNIKQKYQNKQIIIAADNDVRMGGENE